MVGPSLEVDSKDYAENTPFAYAVEKGHDRTVEVFLRSYPELSKTCDRHKELLFHTATRVGNIEMVRIFLNHGADTEMKGDQGRRAIHVAIFAEDTGYAAGAAEVLQLLLAHGVAVDAKDNYGRTPEFYFNHPKTRMILRNHAGTHPNSGAPPIEPIASAPPPEYKA